MADLKYLVIGAGGTGGCIGAYMAKAGKDITLIARGVHLAKMQSEGLKMYTPLGDYTVAVKASDMDRYKDSPDVIFVCVKGYSLMDIIPFIKRISNENTVVIPILNVYGTGEKLQKELPDILVTDGCIYVASQIREPGAIQMNGEIFRIVYGARKPEEYRDILEAIAQDMTDSGITPVLTDKVKRDTLQKFAYVSPAATCGVYYGATSGDMQVPGKPRELLIKLIKEIDELAIAMGIPFDIDIVENNLAILATLSPEALTSMQRDVLAGNSSEMDGLIFEVVRMGERYGVDLPNYNMVAEELHKRGY